MFHQYEAVFKSQLENKIIEEVKSKDRRELIYYILHQSICKEDGKKIRVVYDASAKSAKVCLSLHQYLHIGPLLLQNLSGILYQVSLKLERSRLYQIFVGKKFLSGKFGFKRFNNLSFLQSSFWIKP